jgi:hypothetical protein
MQKDEWNKVQRVMKKEKTEYNICKINKERQTNKEIIKQ